MIDTTPLARLPLPHAARLALLLAAVLAVAVGVSAARLVWELVPAPPERAAPPAATADRADAPAADAGNAAATVRDWHLFGRAASREAGAASRIDAPETRLNLGLRGVLYSPVPEHARALVQQDGGAARTVAVDDELPGGSRVEAIYEDRIILRRNGAFEALSLPAERVPLDRGLADGPLTRDNGQRAGAAPVPEGASDAGAAAGELAAYRRQLAADPGRQAQMLSLQPALEGGEMVGVEVAAGQDPRLMELLGLEAGDVVTAIDGTPLDDPTTAFETLQGLSGDGPVTFRVLRDGTEQTMQADFN